MDTKVKLLVVLILCAVLSGGSAKSVKRSIMGNIQSGIKYAGKMFGIDTAADVADLVSRAFSKTAFETQTSNRKQGSANDDSTQSGDQTSSQSAPNPLPDPTGLMTGLIRLMGLDPSKLGALALNGIVFIAQMIGKMLIRPPGGSSGTSRLFGGFEDHDDEHDDDNDENAASHDDQIKKPRSVSDGTPIDWILNNPNESLGKLLIQVRDRNLPQNLIEMVGKFEPRAGDGDCIKLLLCKSAPFVWGMQKAITERIDGVTSDADFKDGEGSKREKVDKMEIMFKHIPELHEFRMHGDACEIRYEKCKIYD